MVDALSSSSDTRRHGVVVAIRRADGRWLCVRRAANLERAPLKIGMPGGEVEPGETQEQAIAREMMEELNVVVRPLRRVWDFDWPDRPWRLFGWLAEITGGELKPNPAEIAEVHWFTAEEAAGHPDALPTMGALVAALAEALAS
jgi:8-oxo-dGTP diphosphatase